MTETSKGTALITGASSGIGAIYADRLARRGYDLILVARNKARLDALAERLTDETGRAVEVIAADLGNKDDLGRVEKVLRTDASITTLVNNAGIGATAPLLASDIDKMDEMIALNVSALTRLTYAAVPGFVKRDTGSIINIASVVAIAPELLNGVYGGSKAFVLAFTLSLQKELAGNNIRIQAVLPGATATEFWGIGRNATGACAKRNRHVRRKLGGCLTGRLRPRRAGHHSGAAGCTRLGSLRSGTAEAHAEPFPERAGCPLSGRDITSPRSR